MKVVVCIPCYRTHVKYIPELLSSIERQTRKPDILAISISGWKSPDPQFTCSIPIRIRTTPLEGSPAENRNWAAELAINDADILSFIDADDIMHSRRIECIEHHMRDPAVGAVYHSYASWNSGDRAIEEPISGALQHGKWTEFKSNHHLMTASVHYMVGSTLLTARRFALHKGHVTVKSGVFRNIQFPLNRERYDDSEFLYLLHSRGVHPRVLKDKLSFFRQGASTLTCSGESSSQS